MDVEHVHLKVGIRHLIQMGFWPLKFENKYLSLTYSAYFRLILTFYIAFVVSECIELYFVIKRGNLSEFSTLMESSCLHVLGLGKIYVMKGKVYQKLTEKLLVTERNILSGDDEDIKKIYMEHVKRNHAVNRIMSFLANITIIMYMSTPIILNVIHSNDPLYDVIDNSTIVYRPRRFIMPSWTPFDRYKYYKTSLVIQATALLILPSYTVACNNYFFGLTIFCVGQIKILQSYVLNIGKGKEKLSLKDFVVKDDLRRCILYQKSILAFVKDLSDAMKTFMLFDFMVTGLMIAMIGFQAAVINLLLPLATQLSYLVSVLTQLYFYYWHANAVKLESMEVANSAWKSEWSNYSKSNKMTLLIFITKAQRPMTLSVGPFYQMSTETMMLILRSGYSYAAIMRTIYSDK